MLNTPKIPPRVGKRIVGGHGEKMSTGTPLNLELLHGSQATDAACPIQRALADQIAFAATPISMVDTQMRYIAASPAWCAEYKLDVTAILGKSHYEVFPEIPERWRELHRRSLAGEPLSSDLDLFARARGAVQWLRWSTRPWRTLTGEIGGMVMVVNGVNEIHRLRAAADEAHEEFEVLFENKAIGVVLAEWNGRILRANASFAALTGRDPAEITGLEVESFFQRAPEHAKGEGEPLTALLHPLREGRVTSVAERLVLHAVSGRTTWVHCTATRVRGSHGAAPRIALFVHDESARIELEQRMRVADRLASIGMLGAGLGHDLQNVLLPIQAHLNALTALRNDFTTVAARERYEQHTDAMRSCVAYLRQLADGMHFLSRASSSSSEESTVAEITALRSWWSTVEPLFTAALPREIRFEETFKARCGDVQIDPSVLTQVVLNLVVNARDAVVQRHGTRGQGGEIRVAFGPARLDKRRAVRIAVSDNGIGMSAETRARACEVFFTTKPSGRGTGLGLAMVTKAVEEARGKIEITSTLGVGTTIEIVLPAARDAIAARDVSASRDASSSRRAKP